MKRLFPRVLSLQGTPWGVLIWGLLFLLMMLAACADAAPSMPPTSTPDYALLETLTEKRLQARLTAKAPLPTETPTPTPSPMVTASPTVEESPTTPLPTPTVPPPVLVYVAKGEDGATNVVASSLGNENQEMLTHFTEPLNMTDLAWSKEGDWLAFVSSHDFLFSRANERNIFIMRPDGTELQMVTGEYLDPLKASAPYVTLEGVVQGGRGRCRVMAQGATNPVETSEAEGFAFVLPSVPRGAAWIRAVCQEGDMTYQGDTVLTLEEGKTAPVLIVVEPKGQGWQDISFAPGGRKLVGTFYRWWMEGEKRQYEAEGVILDLDLGTMTPLELPEGMTFHGADWSFDGERIVGGVANDKETSLWLWDANGKSIGPLLTLPNPDDQYLTIARPVWAPKDARVAFELHRWYWWSEPKYRTDLMVLEAGHSEASPLVSVEWGQHATQPCWTSTGLVVFYQFHAQEGELGPGLPPEANIWSAVLENGELFPWTEDGASYLPAVRPGTF